MNPHFFLIPLLLVFFLVATANQLDAIRIGTDWHFVVIRLPLWDHIFWQSGDCVAVYALYSGQLADEQIDRIYQAGRSIFGDKKK